MQTGAMGIAGPTGTMFRLRLGLDAEVPKLGIRNCLTLGEVASGAVAACVGDHDDELNQALFRKSHDVLILSAALAPRIAEADTWTRPQRQWTAQLQRQPAFTARYRSSKGCFGWARNAERA